MVLIKFSMFSLLLFTSLIARENPFFPSEGEKDIAYTSNQEKNIPMLKRATLTLPTHARVIESIVVHYKNLDGSLSQKKIPLNNSIDWHLPIFISQNYNSNQITTTPKRSKYKKVAAIRYAQFFTKDKKLKIITQDKLLRHFSLVKPYRIIVDFQRDTNLKSYTKKIPNTPFAKIRIGNHSGYYRVVLELDGQYKYIFHKSENSYVFELY